MLDTPVWFLYFAALYCPRPFNWEGRKWPDFWHLASGSSGAMLIMSFRRERVFPGNQRQEDFRFLSVIVLHGGAPPIDHPWRRPESRARPVLEQHTDPPPSVFDSELGARPTSFCVFLDRFNFRPLYHVSRLEQRNLRVLQRHQHL